MNQENRNAGRLDEEIARRQFDLVRPLTLKKIKAAAQRIARFEDARWKRLEAMLVPVMRAHGFANPEFAAFECCCAVEPQGDPEELAIQIRRFCAEMSILWEKTHAAELAKEQDSCCSLTEWTA